MWRRSSKSWCGPGKRFPKAGMVGKEYKATKAPKEVTRYILEELARCDCEIVVLMVGQVRSTGLRRGYERVVRCSGCGDSSFGVWENHPDARPVLHQRYDNVVLRDRITTLLIAKAREMGIKLDREEVQHRRGNGGIWFGSCRCSSLERYPMAAEEQKGSQSVRDHPGTRSWCKSFSGRKRNSELHYGASLGFSL